MSADVSSADLSDGDLARLARGSDPAAFRLLVERHQAMVRARARQLAPDPGDWTTHEVTAPVPDDTNTVAFGVFLAGPGRIELRSPRFEGAPVTHDDNAAPDVSQGRRGFRAVW